jgi:protein gp37
MTRIDWADDTVNFFTGCRHGCDFCYAKKMARRLAGVPGTVYQRVAAVNPEDDPFEVAFHADVFNRSLDKYRGARKPRRIFVGSMGDMCFGGVAAYFNGKDGLAGNVITREVQGWTAEFARDLPDHTILVLTKRPDLLDPGVPWPENVHLGVSVTGNADAGRIEELHRWWGSAAANQTWIHAGGPGVLWASVEPLLDASFDPACLAGLDWVVVGMDSSWRYALRTNSQISVPMMRAVERIVAWCRENGVPVWCKGSTQALTTGTFPQEISEKEGQTWTFDQ